MSDPSLTSLQDIYHWAVKFFGFPMTSELGQDLANHHQIHPPPVRRWRPPTEEEKPPTEVEIKQTEICLEMKFLPDYPNSAPLFRVISPHLNFTDGTGMAAAIAHAVATAGEKESMQVDRYADSVSTSLMRLAAMLFRLRHKSPLLPRLSLLRSSSPGRAATPRRRRCRSRATSRRTRRAGTQTLASPTSSFAFATSSKAAHAWTLPLRCAAFSSCRFP